MKILLLMAVLLSGCQTSGYYYVSSDTLNSAMVQECRTKWFVHSEDPNETKTTKTCRKFLMTLDQLSAWKSIQKGLHDRGMPDGIVLED